MKVRAVLVPPCAPLSMWRVTREVDRAQGHGNGEIKEEAVDNITTYTPLRKVVNGRFFNLSGNGRAGRGWALPLRLLGEVGGAPGRSRSSQPSRGFKSVGRHSEYPICTVRRCVGRGPRGSSEPPEPRICFSPWRAGGSRAARGGGRCRRRAGRAWGDERRERVCFCASILVQTK